MAKKILATNATCKRIRDVGLGARRIEPSVVAEALGAEGAETEIGLKGSPVTFFQLRAGLAKGLKPSSGGPSSGLNSGTPGIQPDFGVGNGGGVQDRGLRSPR